jgi:hypothetical protein
MSQYLGNSENMTYRTNVEILEELFNTNISTDSVPDKAKVGGNLNFYANTTDKDSLDQVQEFCLYNPEQKFYYYFIK